MLHASIALLLFCLVVPASIEKADAADAVIGAGSTLAGPLYSAWAQRRYSDVSVNYQPMGSGAGQNQVISRTVDFGATDAPMTVQKLVGDHLVQIPTVIGAIVPIVNLPGIRTDQLCLSGEIIADLYSGRISEWDDPRIKKLNPGLQMPPLPVAAIHRADASGSTYVFTRYLSKVSVLWATQIGAAPSVAWPDGEGGRGNDGVSAAVRNTVGSVGYVEYAFAIENHLVIAKLLDGTGHPVAAQPESFLIGAGSADWHVSSLAVDIIGMPAKGAWPLLSATYVLLPTEDALHEKSRQVARFFNNAIKSGDAIAMKLGYVPLPTRAKQEVSMALSHAGIIDAFSQ